MATRRRILHLIPSLAVGGAERMLENLILSTDGRAFEHEVVTLRERGSIGARLLDRGVWVRELGLEGFGDVPGALGRLRDEIRARQPAVMHSWMYHANLLGGVAALPFPETRVLWAIHHTKLIPRESPLSTSGLVRMGGVLSSALPHAIVCCSRSALRAHRDLGYAQSRMCVIPNGFDTDTFMPSRLRRERTRQELGLVDEDEVIGLVARFNPVKHHENFVDAARIVAGRRPRARFLLCGRGVDDPDGPVKRWVKEAGLSDRFLLLPERGDMSTLYPALDLATLCSRSEGFPTVVGEAMSCGIPNVVTDVGDSSELVGDAGWVVPPANAERLAAAWHEVLAMGAAQRAAMSRRARARIERNFSARAIARRYEDLYRTLIEDRFVGDEPEAWIDGSEAGAPA